jgi:Domain of unknown function (DUF4126)
MHGIFFYIGLGAGLASACGLRPFTPVLLAGALASAKALGVSFALDPFHFLQAGWWLLIVAVVLVAAYAAQLLLGQTPALDPASKRSAPSPLAAAIAGMAYGTGALLFAGTLAAHRDAWWPGVIGGLAAVWLAQAAVGPVIAGARSRLGDRAAREALSVYLDTAALVCALLIALLHPLGYILLAALALLLLRARSRADEKYAGLRVLRR